MSKILHGVLIAGIQWKGVKAVAPFFVLMFFLMGANSAFGYTISIQPLRQSVYAYEMLNDPDLRLYGYGDDYVEVEGISDPYGRDPQSVRFGTSVSSNTSESTLENGNTIFSAFLNFDTWAYSEPGLFFETNYHIEGNFLFNVSSDYNDDTPIYMNAYFDKDMIGMLGWDFYDDEKSVYLHEEEGPVLIVPGVDYYIDFQYYLMNIDQTGGWHYQENLGFELAETIPVPEPPISFFIGIGLVGWLSYRRYRSRSQTLVQ